METLKNEDQARLYRNIYWWSHVAQRTASKFKIMMDVFYTANEEENTAQVILDYDLWKSGNVQSLEVKDLDVESLMRRGFRLVG